MLFAFIPVPLATFILWASTRQPAWEWGGFTTPPDNLWTIATLIDAYYGFVGFHVWVPWMAANYLGSKATAVSNSRTQKMHIDAKAHARNLANSRQARDSIG
jgi:hypothetical protein